MPNVDTDHYPGVDYFEYSFSYVLCTNNGLSSNAVATYVIDAYFQLDTGTTVSQTVPPAGKTILVGATTANCYVNIDMANFCPWFTSYASPECTSHVPVFPCN